MWAADLVDMGERTVKPTGNRYMTIFVILQSRLVMIFLHQTKDKFLEQLQKGHSSSRKEADNSQDRLRQGVPQQGTGILQRTSHLSADYCGDQPSPAACLATASSSTWST